MDPWVAHFSGKNDPHFYVFGNDSPYPRPSATEELVDGGARRTHEKAEQRRNDCATLERLDADRWCASEQFDDAVRRSERELGCHPKPGKNDYGCDCGGKAGPDYPARQYRRNPVARGRGWAAACIGRSPVRLLVPSRWSA